MGNDPDNQRINLIHLGEQAGPRRFAGFDTEIILMLREEFVAKVLPGRTGWMGGLPALGRFSIDISARNPGAQRLYARHGLEIVYAWPRLPLFHRVVFRIGKVL